MSSAAKWFSRSLWLGLLLDWAIGVPAIFAPETALRWFGETPAPSPIWVAFPSLLLVLLSLFYVPIALEPYRFPGVARLAVLVRLLQAVFFLWLYAGEYPLRGWANLGLFLVQAPLLYYTLRSIPRPGEPEDRDPDPVSTNDLFEYEGTTFAEAEAVVFANPLTQLPIYRSLGPADLTQLFNASARNLSDRRDIRPYFDKLIHAHGICHTGEWAIDTETPFTGYFAKGSRGLLLVRFSVAGPAIRRGQLRAIGIAGKIFPTLDPNLRVKPGNFVTVSHLSGLRARHIVDLEPSNSPSIGWGLAANVVNRIIFRLMDTRPGLRLLHPVSTLGVARGAPVVTPDLMKLTVAEGTTRVDAEDFRDELRVARYGGKLVYDIQVKNFADEYWTRIGTITLTRDVVSEGGDKRLHFWIPSDLPSHN